MFEKVQRSCIRPLNPPILGDFDLQNPPEWGGRGVNAELDRTSQTPSKAGRRKQGKLEIRLIRIPNSEFRWHSLRGAHIPNSIPNWIWSFQSCLVRCSWGDRPHRPAMNFNIRIRIGGTHCMVRRASRRS